MVTDKYQILLAVINESSLSKAAEKLGYTPSGISKLVASIEEEMGFKLFVRSKSGIRPTAECEKILPLIRNITHDMNSLQQLISEINGVDTGTITIGTPYIFYYKWLADLIANFTKEFPAIEVKLITENSSALMEAMNNHEIDIALMSKREGKGRWIHLITNPMDAWLPNDHPLAGAKSFPLKAYRNEPYIMPSVGEDTDSARILRANGIIPKNVRYEASDPYAAFCLVDAGLGVSMMNRIVMGSWKGNVVSMPLDPPQNIEIGIMAPLNDELSPATKKLVAYMEEFIKSISEQ